MGLLSPQAFGLSLARCSRGSLEARRSLLRALASLFCTRPDPRRRPLRLSRLRSPSRHHLPIRPPRPSDPALAAPPAPRVDHHTPHERQHRHVCARARGKVYPAQFAFS